MNVGTFSIRNVCPKSITDNGKMLRFTVEFEGMTTKEEFDRFTSALSDGIFIFKGREKLGEGEDDRQVVQGA